jgi:hypothetical protein
MCRVHRKGGMAAGHRIRPRHENQEIGITEDHLLKLLTTIFM